MATVTDVVAAAYIGRDQNPWSTDLPTLTVVTFVVNPIVAPTVLRGPLNNNEHLEKFTGVNFKRW